MCVALVEGKVDPAEVFDGHPGLGTSSAAYRVADAKRASVSNTLDPSSSNKKNSNAFYIVDASVGWIVDID